MLQDQGAARLPLFDTTFVPPHHLDFMPRLYPVEVEKRVLFLQAVKHFKRRRNWFGSEHLPIVRGYVLRHVNKWRLALPRHEWEKVSVDVVRLLTADLASGRTLEGLRTYCAAWGVKGGEASGVSRRKVNEPRDNAIVKALLAGQGVRSVARDYDLAPSTVCRIRNARI